MTSAPAIGFEYRPSRQLRLLLLCVTVLALLAVGLCALPIWCKLLLWLIVVAATLRSMRQLSNGFIVAAGWSHDDSWTLHTEVHDDLPAMLASFRILGSWVLLRLQTSHGMQVMLLAPDNSDADIRRRLRMRLATLKAQEAVPRL